MTPDVVFRIANTLVVGVYNNPSFDGAPAPAVDQPMLQRPTAVLPNEKRN
jgi:hypothetical protein